MRSLIIAAFALSAIAAPAFAAPCKDAHGKFMKCPPMRVMPMRRCKDIHGKFMKCR
ncbi:hypothetical protein [Caulobacter sp. S45]|jgi:hypothetical protein|uniref:hypothetical protein n=1 Tax=Caulobacter sp. S45 TaxID=1641861 RepID=UPI001575F98A|nr:hypothetical protein [Caulobacter sp. S45]